METDTDIQKNEKWFSRYWRPAMAWQYLVVCIFDFMLAPIGLAIFCYYTKTPFNGWEPLTLKGGGLYHASMAVITGVTAWSRGQEKIASMNNGVAQ